jgi:hypothetical protein
LIAHPANLTRGRKDHPVRNVMFMLLVITIAAAVTVGLAS